MEQIATILGMSKEDVQETIEKHLNDIDRMNMLEKEFIGRYEETEEKTAGKNTKTKYNGNHAKYITTVITSYFIGNPIKYIYDESTEEVEEEGKKTNILQHFKLFSKSKEKEQDDINKEAIASLNDWYKRRHVADHDFKMAKNMSIFAKAHELLYVDPFAEGIQVKIKALDPRRVILFKLNDLEETVVGAMYYYKKNEKEGNSVYLYTDTEIYEFTCKDVKGQGYVLVDEPTTHMFGSVPIIEYYNNDEIVGDFEQSLSLIKAYNDLMSDRLNDVKDFLDAILIVMGGTLDDKKLKKDKMIEIPSPKDGAKVEWLTKSLDQSQVESLVSRIQEDISKFSFVPNLMDENFAGNSSGVALAFKLIGMELLIKEKETHFSKGIRLRIKRLFSLWANTHKGSYDYEAIDFDYIHELPIGMDEYEVVKMLEGIVSERTLLELIPEIDDVDAEMERIEEERNNKQKRNASGSFGNVFGTSNTLDQEEEKKPVIKTKVDVQEE